MNTRSRLHLSLAVLAASLLSLTSMAAQAVPKAAETEDQPVVQSAPVVHPKMHTPAKKVVKAASPKKPAKATKVTDSKNKARPAKAHPQKVKPAPNGVKTNTHHKPVASRHKRG